jgi:uncharacterized protein (TIGR03067 family)
LLARADSASDLAAKNILDKLQGTWQVVRVETDGKSLPEETIKGWTLTVDGAKYVLREGDRTAEGVYKFDPIEMPRAIDALRTAGPGEGKALWGIYQLDGDRLRLCFVEPDRHERPKDFVTGGANGGQVLYILERISKR